MNSPIHNLASQDDLNLIEFLRTLWQQKFLIGLVTVLSLSLALVYLFFATPIYEAKADLRCPTMADLSHINQGRSGERHAPLFLLKPKDVYAIFTKILQSESTKRDFFQKIYLKKINQNSSENDYLKFSKSLSVNEIRTIPSNIDPGSSDYMVSYRGKSAKQDAEIVKEYIAMAKQKAIDELLADLTRQRHIVLRTLKTRVAFIREVANTARLDRIEQLKEAIKVAQVVGLKGGTVSPLKGVIADVSIIDNPHMMYLQGSAALLAELDNLINRKSSDAFIPESFGLRKTQALLESYEKISYSEDKIIMFRMDSEVREPDLKIAPRQKFILLLSIIAGLFLGITFAITRKSLTLIFKDSAF